MLKDAHAGLTILMKYDPEAELCGEHDVWLVAVHKSDISDEDIIALKVFGWNWDSEYDSFRKFT